MFAWLDTFLDLGVTKDKARAAHEIAAQELFVPVVFELHAVSEFRHPETGNRTVSMAVVESAGGIEKGESLEQICVWCRINSGHHSFYACRIRKTAVFSSNGDGNQRKTKKLSKKVVQNSLIV